MFLNKYHYKRNMSGFQAAGLLYRENFLFVRDLVVVPSWLGYLASRLLGWLVRSPPPTDTSVPMGATLEIQRQQQMEALEQQLIWAQLQQRPQVRHYLFGGSPWCSGLGVGHQILRLPIQTPDW